MSMARYSKFGTHLLSNSIKKVDCFLIDRPTITLLLDFYVMADVIKWKRELLLLNPHSFDWLATFHLYLLQAILFIAG